MSSKEKTMNRFTLSRRLRTGRKRPAHARPLLERLEDRTVLSTFPVLNLADSGADSLRQAILDANNNPGADVITFARGLHGTITLTSGELQITNDLDIEGPGANKLTISGSNSSRIFDIGPDATDVTIAGLTIADGLADGNAPVIHSVGGGILNQGDLTLNHVVVSHNLAVGATKDKIRINQMDLTGVGGGGGVANLGTLTVSDSTFTSNQAQGANGNKEGNFPGLAWGGGLANGGVATATITDSRFTSNLAQGGNGSISSLTPGLAGGGAIGNFGFGTNGSPGSANLIVSGSTFSNNQAIAGNDNKSPIFPGHVVGGAIASDNLSSGSASLDVSDSTFDHNQAIGGNHNVATRGGAEHNSAIAGGIYVGLTGTISDSTFRYNQAIGGQGLAGSSGDPSTVNGGDARGGGIDVAWPTTVVTVSNCTLEYNLAIAGQAGVGGTGGNAWGGGVANSLPGAMLTITGCIIDHNQAQGGCADTSGPASNGGSGLGGGVYNVSGSTTYVIASAITDNQAIGGAGSHGGSDGQGVGGGAYFADGGIVCLDFFTDITGNTASTSDPDIFGSYTTCC
jgi:hypothetical protein